MTPLSRHAVAGVFFVLGLFAVPPAAWADASGDASPSAADAPSGSSGSSSESQRLVASGVSALREAGVTTARAGNLPEGRRLLEAALAADPRDTGTLADLVVVLTWQGQDGPALQRFAQLGDTRAPAYAISAAAVAARRSGQATRSVELYRLAETKGDTGLETRLGLALAQAQLGQRGAARATLAAAAAAEPGNARLAQVSAEIARMPPPPGIIARVDSLMNARRYFDALRLIEPMLREYPGEQGLRRREALALAAVGAPALALVRGGQTLLPEEQRRIRGSANAFLVRWGAQISPRNPRNPAARYARTDAAIAAIDAAIAAWTRLGPRAAGAVRNARLDRVVALYDRNRMQEVIDEAAALSEAGPLPAYVREVLAGALLDRRRPEEAEAEYRAVLEADPGALRPSMGLAYALADQRRWTEALAIADQLQRDIPTHRALRDGGSATVPEWGSVDALALSIQLRMWTDDLARAERDLAPAVNTAPMNSTLRTLRGDIWRMRGWPEQALEEYEIALTNDPDSRGLRIGRAEAMLDRRMWREARAEIQALQAQYPEDSGVRRLVRRLQVRDMREVEVTVRGGLDRGSSDPELYVSARLYSAPIAENWRAFTGAALRTGNTPSGWLTTYRGLAGLEWRGPVGVVSGGVTYDVQGVDRPGAFLNAAVRLSDRWSVELGAELTAIDTPLAALRAGIYADTAGLGLTWRQSDMREAGASVRVMHFSDTNTRMIGFGRWQERVMNLPDWKLDLQPYAYATSNSLANAPYYNPSSDLETGVTGALTWIAWRRYEQDLRVRLIATGGGYWQEGFGWSPVLAMRWENQQSFSDTFGLTYGLGWIRRNYDGVQRDSATVAGALRWRF